MTYIEFIRKRCEKGFNEMFDEYIQIKPKKLIDFKCAIRELASIKKN